MTKKPKRKSAKRPGPNPMYPTAHVLDNLHTLCVCIECGLVPSDGVRLILADPELAEWRRQMDQRAATKQAATVR